MSTPLEPLPRNSYAEFAPAPESPVPAPIDPDNPPWGVGLAILTWLASVFVLGLIPYFAVLSYFSYRHIPATAEAFNNALTNDPVAILTSLVSVLPSHLVTFVIVWILATGFGKRPFWQTIGWSWGTRFGFWSSAGLAVSLLVVGSILLKYFGGEKTPFDQAMESSVYARFATVILATATAPFIEELIYRGVLYSALQRAMGVGAAIILVSLLFAFVHVFQYYNNLGVIAAVTTLSFTLTYVRARTGRLLPCFIIHLVFNGIQAAGLIYEYFYPFSPIVEPKPALIMAAHSLGFF